MKIVDIKTYLVDAGWRPWGFVKVETDEGISGYGDCTCVGMQYSVLGAIEDFKPTLLGADPRAHEMRFWDMYRRLRLGNVGGSASKALGAIECALLDIKAKALGISVAELFGGPTRETVPVYFSHFLSQRTVVWDFVGKKRVRTMADVAEAAQEVLELGFKAVKLNVLDTEEPMRAVFDGFGGGLGTTDQYVSIETLRGLETLFGTVRDAVGPDMGLILDMNFNCKPESCVRIARALEPFDLWYIELDMFDPESLLQIKQAIDVPICSGETLYYMEGYLPYFEKRAFDIVMVDTIWNGFAQAKKVADLAQVYQLNVCPHNAYSPLSTFICANLAAALPNVRILELEGDDLPWAQEFITEPIELSNGELRVPTKPGWGTELDEKTLRRRSWGSRVSQISIPTEIGEAPDAASSAARPAAQPPGEGPMLARTNYDNIAGPWAKDGKRMNPDDAS